MTALLSDTPQSNTFNISANTQIYRLGYGAMRVTGHGIWGLPNNYDEAIRTLKSVPELGINFIDTADSYGPDVSEALIKEALYPYADNLVIATKGGLTRQGPDLWRPVGRPEYLIQQVYKSLRNLNVEQIDLWQLHRIDPKVPADEQFDTIKFLIDKQLIRYAGLSEVSVPEMQQASKYFKVSTVQNRYNLIDRTNEEVLNYCEFHNIGFIPWYPLSGGILTRPNETLDNIALKHNATLSQIALAWILKRSPILLPIPGTSQVLHLEQNAASGNISLSDEDFTALTLEGEKIYNLLF
ncbi:aldo/keto reductase [Acetobacter syzygii]|uniref:Oxidoreductase n=1 Tax=Acetobacter syzygii TaxID=146476 RepID=A0A270BH98_9PROT|nr:aldo/keto reductase [Acetobacter syzygii]PAL23981.1 oxidoreductase [Acetobacter syzygii]PAL24700.1 oxidoreductase [Acetobacter syzygii]